MVIPHPISYYPTYSMVYHPHITTIINTITINTIKVYSFFINYYYYYYYVVIIHFILISHSFLLAYYSLMVYNYHYLHHSYYYSLLITYDCSRIFLSKNPHHSTHYHIINITTTYITYY